MKSNSILRQKVWFQKWIIGKRTLQELSSESKKSISTLQRLFKNFLDKPPRLPIRENHKCHLIIDGVHFGQELCLLNYLDDDLKYLQLYSLTERENFENFLIDLSLLKSSGLQIVSITSDGKKGLIQAVKQIFPQAIHQRCLIHIQRMSLTYLTKFPKTEAGATLRILVKKLHQINSYQRRDIWLKLFNRWREEYNNFLQEKSESPAGRKWYTHKLLRRTRSLIKNGLPNLFHYLDDAKIPKSTNGLETRFSYLKNNLKIHRGLTKKNRRNFILWYNYFKYKF